VSQTLRSVVVLVEGGDVKVSEHGYDELAADGILVKEVVAGVRGGIVVEDYPDYPQGPCVLVLQSDSEGRPLHVVWGYRKGLHPLPFS
jgi:hypothetical protein